MESKQGRPKSPLPEAEIVLAGGNVNPGVVRMGTTVRRRMTPASATVHQLLLHLEKVGFAGSPRFLGVDDQGREVLTFLAGETGILPTIWQDDEPLQAAATLLRHYHDATVGFTPPEPARWVYRYPDEQLHEVICHNDFAPYNLVYTDGSPSAVIDFDLARPGPRLRDVAYAAYWMVPLSFNSEDQRAFAQADLDAGSRRCRLFCATYGIHAGPDLCAMIGDVLKHMGSEDAMRQMVGDEAAGRLMQAGHLRHWQREAAAFRKHRARLEENLSAANPASHVS